MGHSKAEKAETHKRIVKIASKRFREDGLAGIRIAELMKEAGLTVGGFYKHFDSRDHLVAEAVNSGFGGWKRRVEAAESSASPVSYEKLIDEYLNAAHRVDGVAHRRSCQVLCRRGMEIETDAPGPLL